MDGYKIIVEINTQDGVGNTMSADEFIIYEDTGYILGYSMRRIFAKDDVGCYVGIHMKTYRDFFL